MNSTDAMNILFSGDTYQAPLYKSDVTNWHGHIPFAFFLMAVCRPRVFVELGTHKGDSYSAFCQAVTAAGTGARCFAVDTWRGDPQAGYYDDRVYRDLQTYHDSLYSSFSTLLRCTFDEAQSQFGDGSIDILHIDGCHTYEAVRHDFGNWLAKMSDTGIILLHDIAVRTDDFGVWRFWDELENRYPTLAFSHSNGLGVAAVGKNVPPGLKPLLIDREAAKKARSFFAYLGELILEESRMRVNAAGSLPGTAKPSATVPSCRIYGGRDGSFSEQDSYAYPLPQEGSGAMEAVHAIREEWRGLRIDPVDVPAVIADPVIEVEQEPDGPWQKYSPQAMEMAGIIPVEGMFLVLGDDPQFIKMDMVLPAGSVIRVRFSYELIGEAELQARIATALRGYQGTIAEMAADHAQVMEEMRTLERDHARSMEEMRTLGRAEQARLRSLVEELDGIREQSRKQAEALESKDRAIVDLDSTLKRHDLERQAVQREIVQMKDEAVRAREALSAMKTQFAHVRDELALVKSTRGWRMLDALRILRSLARDPVLVWRKLSASVRQLGWSATLQRVKDKLLRPSGFTGGVSYHEWQIRREAEFLSNKGMVRTEIATWDECPLVSIVMPTYNSREEWLKDAVDSLLVQPYDNWELIVTDDHSPDPDTRQALGTLADLDRRITVIMNDQNRGIGGNTNVGIECARGELLTFLDHDDLLSPWSLYEVVKTYREKKFDVAYSDEDKLSEDGVFEDAFFKPDYSPDYILSCNYFNHLTVYRRAVLDRIGLLRSEYDGAQDYDLVLRALEVSHTVVHIPDILYHWRKVSGSTAAGFGAKSYAHEAGREAVAAALARRGERAEVLDVGYAGHYRVRRELSRHPLVSIIIPIRDKVDILRVCLENLRKSSYTDTEIIIVDNGSTEPETLVYLSGLTDCRVLRYDIPFNFSRLNNLAARESAGEVLLFLNNDIEAITTDWMEEMLQHALRPEIGAVGAKLLYPDERIQHAGIVLGIGGVAGHAHKYFHRLSEGYFSMLADIRNFSAVTGACMMVRKDVFEQVGGFDETNLAVAFNDVDLCLKIGAAGYRCVVTPFAELYHHESISRGLAMNYNEIFYMQKRWGDLLRNDPFYSPYLSLIYENYSFDPFRPSVRDRHFHLLVDEVLAAFDETGVDLAVEDRGDALEMLAQVYAIRPDLQEAFQMPDGRISVQGLLHWAVTAGENGDSCRPVLEPHSVQLEEVLSTVGGQHEGA